MIDEMTRDALRVSTDGTAGPYLMLPLSQLDAVVALLDRHDIRYWVDADAISLDNEPLIAVINFGRSGESDRIQAILDEAADGRVSINALVRRDSRTGQPCSGPTR